MGLLRTLAVILLVYFGIRLLFYWLAPRLFAYAARKAENHFREVFSQQHGQEYAPQPGNITIEKKTKKKDKDREKVGEYIEFEEIE